MDKLTKIAYSPRTLSVETRIKILDELQDEFLCVGALNRKLNISQSTLSVPFCFGSVYTTSKGNGYTEQNHEF